MSCIITDLRPIDLSLAETKPALIAVSPTVSIQTALSKMMNNKITSLPVFSHKNTEVVSIVNLFDILLYLVGENNDTSIQKEKLKLDDPVENVLGLDSDRESYRMHKTDRKDKLIEVSNEEI
jgi:CBS domain-containing protein